MAAESTVPTTPGVFSRQASGLVRVGGAGDVLIFNLALISLGIGVVYNEFFAPSSYPGASAAIGTLVSGVLMLPVVATFYFWTVILPRSGGNYVFLSRTFNPGLAFVLSLVETVEFAWACALGASLIASAGVS